MNNNEPIEIELAINSPEVIKQAAQVDAALNGLDSSVSSTEAKFKAYEQEQLRAAKIAEKFEKTVEKQSKTIRNQGNAVKNQKRQFDGLGHSITQITRELPAFTFSAQTGFAAISNNIPMLTDEIAKLKQKNDELKASGKKGIPIWKQLAKSFFSLNTLISFGVTFLTMYGKEIFEFTKGLFGAGRATSTFKLNLKTLNNAFESSPYKKAIKNIIELKAQTKLAKEGVASKTSVIKKYNEILGKTAGTAKNLKDVEDGMVKNADNYVKMAYYKAAANLAIEEAANKAYKAEKRRNDIKFGDLANKDKFKLLTSNNLFTGLNFSNLIFDVKEAKKNAGKASERLKQEGKSLLDIYDDLYKRSKKYAKKLNITDLDSSNPTSSINNYKQLLQKIADLDTEYSRKRLPKDKQELRALQDKFEKVRKLVQQFNAKNKIKIELSQLDNLQKQAEKQLTYKQGTERLEKQLDKERELFDFYESLKTKTNSEEAEKRYGDSLRGFKNYGDALQAEYEKLQDSVKGKTANEITGAEAERISKLANRIQAYKNRQSKKDQEQFIQAYNTVVTHQEKLQQLEADFAQKKTQLQKITDQKLQQQKLKLLDNQKKDAIDAANAEAYAKEAVFIKLSDDLIGLSKKELAIKIASLEEYLKTAENSLSESQKKQVESQVEAAKSVQAQTDLGVRQKALLQQKQGILKRIETLQKKGVKNVEDEQKALEKLNQTLAEINAEKLNQVADAAYQIGSALVGLASDIAPFNEELADSLETAGELANVFGDVASSAASFYSGDVVGGITGAISAIGGLFQMSAKVRESEKKAREEMRKWQEELFQAQLNYNAELRKRISEEIKLNDLYKSRVANIKEEIAANKEKTAQIVQEQQTIFNRLLKAQTIVGKQTYKTGGFFGLWKKTKIKDVKKSIAEILNLGKSVSQKVTPWFSVNKFVSKDSVKLTDELYDSLERLNGQKPLTGDAKAAFEQLKKLKDEYGSIEAANRELKKQLKDAVTGTTAKALADSIREGVLSGKKTFADFADDIEKFLSQAIIAGMSAKVIEPQMQKLQDQLYTYLGDGVLTADEKAQFEEMYLKVADEARQYMDLINQSGLKIGNTVNQANSLRGAVKGATAEEINLLAGQFGGLRLTQLETNRLLSSSHFKQLEQSSKSVETQLKIERNTKRTADNTEHLKSIDKTLKDLKDNKNNNAKANGIP